MKPCRKNRKLIVLRSIAALSQSQSEEIDRHLDQCEGCARYRDEIVRVTLDLRSLDASQQPAPGAEAWTLRRHAVQPSSALHSLFDSGAWKRWGFIATSFALVILALCLSPTLLRRPARYPVEHKMSVGPSSHPTPENLAPTFANYRALANQSLDELDQVLTKQAAKAAPASTPLTVATAAFTTYGE